MQVNVLKEICKKSANVFESANVVKQREEICNVGQEMVQELAYMAQNSHSDLGSDFEHWLIDFELIKSFPRVIT